MRSGAKWNSSMARAVDTFAPAIAVVEIEERAGDDDSELLLISSPPLLNIFANKNSEREKCYNNVFGAQFRNSNGRWHLGQA